MPRSNLSRIREKIRFGQYDMTAHAMEEMAEEDLDILDIEEVIFSGKITRIEKDDPRGDKIHDRGYGKRWIDPHRNC